MTDRRKENEGARTKRFRRDLEAARKARREAELRDGIRNPTRTDDAPQDETDQAGAADAEAGDD